MGVKPSSLLSAVEKGHNFERLSRLLLTEIFRRTKGAKAKFSEWTLKGTGKKKMEFEMDLLVLYGEPIFVFLPGFNPQYGLKEQDGRFLVTTANGLEIYVGLVPLNKIMEIAYMESVLEQQRRMMEVEERFLWEMTALVGPSLLLRQPSDVYPV